jgi:hypothetical protein
MSSFGEAITPRVPSRWLLHLMKPPTIIWVLLPIDSSSSARLQPTTGSPFLYWSREAKRNHQQWIGVWSAKESGTWRRNCWSGGLNHQFLYD